jgi:hypothetical protein
MFLMIASKTGEQTTKALIERKLISFLIYSFVSIDGVGLH